MSRSTEYQTHNEERMNYVKSMLAQDLAERQSVVVAADDRMNVCDDIEGSERQRLSSTNQ